MAIYHFSAQIISRSQGRSSVAASAYRAAEKLIDERLGIQHDFTKKNDVVNKTILLPEGAVKDFSNREALWNAVEKTERRKDAQLAREINVALPKELNDERNWTLLNDFVQREFVDNGMVADIAFHRGHTGGEEQPHGHIMLSLREVTPEGFGPKVRDWNDKALLHHWRERWAERCNLELAKHDIDVLIDHRTLEAQGINLEPQSKIGPKAAQSAMARLAEHQALAQRNGERLLKEPHIALDAITKQQSTFTHHDLARFVNRHTLDAEQFQAVFDVVQSHPEMVRLGLDEQGRERFTTQAMLQLEAQMLERACEQSSISNHAVSDKSLTQAMVHKTLTDEQQTALEHITQGADMSAVVGFAGTGKSYLLGAAREAWEREGYRVRGMTLSGIAAENLEGGSGIESHTVASQLLRWQNGISNLSSRDVVVVDEVGMLGSRQMARILEVAHEAKAKVVLVGDTEQLQAIEAGGAFRAITERIGHVTLTDIRRQHADWQKQATQAFASQRTAEGLLAYEQHDNVHTFDTQAVAMRTMAERWDEVRSQSPNTSQIMLAYTRDEVKALNEHARAMRQAQGELIGEQSIETERGMRAFAIGDRVYFLRNERQALNVKNGTLGTIERVVNGHLTVRLDSMDKAPARCVSFDIKDYNHIDHGYAATVYKAQGITVDRAHVLASQYFDRHSTYVAMSRHRDGVDLYVGRDVFPRFNDISRTLSRERIKDVSLDYASVRGVAVEAKRASHSPALPDEKTPPLTMDERLKQAEQRLMKRQYDKAVQADINILEKKTGLSLSMAIQVGDAGTYRGLVEVAGRRYGLLEQNEGMGKLVRAEQIETRRLGQAMVIHEVARPSGKTQLKALATGRERTQERGRGMSGL